MVKATPSVVPSSHSLSSQSVPLIDEALLAHLTPSEQVVGQGRFGSCAQMVFKGMFKVCVKRMSESVSIQAVKAEAAALQKLNAGAFTPHCFGVCVSMKAIIMSYINIDNEPVSLHSLLRERSPIMSLTKQLCTEFIVQLCNGMKYIHDQSILHNDLKLDNVVIGETINKCIRAYIVDFGKACPLSQGKQYHLTEEEKSVYKQEHSQVAPDLRDGVVRQCAATDIYSIGRIIKRLNSMIIHSETLIALAKQLLSYHSDDRPNITNVLESLSKC